MRFDTRKNIFACLFRVDNVDNIINLSRLEQVSLMRVWRDKPNTVFQLNEIHWFFIVFVIDVVVLFLDTPAKEAQELNSVLPSICLSIYNTVFSGLASCFYLIFCLNLGFNKRIKVMEPICWGKFLFGPRWGNWGILEPKINIVDLSLNLIISFFWYCIW